MEKKSRIDLLQSRIFLIGLILLLINDFYFKYEYSNWVTGKLSDFAGLFIFPFFFSAIFPRRVPIIYFLTAVFFVYWSSELSQNLIDFGNENGLPISRTVDYSDFVALSVLPFSFVYFKSKLAIERRGKVMFRLTIASIAVFSFFATTLPKYVVEHTLNTDRTFQISISKTELLKSLNDEHLFLDSLKNDQDSLFYFYFNVPEHRTRVTGMVKIIEMDSANTQINLDSIKSSVISGGLFRGIRKNDIDELTSLTKEEFEEIFNQNFIKKVKSNEFDFSLGYTNKFSLDNYEKKEATNKQ